MHTQSNLQPERFRKCNKALYALCTDSQKVDSIQLCLNQSPSYSHLVKMNKTTLHAMGKNRFFLLFSYINARTTTFGVSLSLSLYLFFVSISLSVLLSFTFSEHLHYENIINFRRNHLSIRIRSSPLPSMCRMHDCKALRSRFGAN